jgi:hypothetical protein
MTNPELRVDGKTRKFGNDVEMVHELPEGETLTIKLTHEGVIMDVADETGEVVRTASLLVDDLDDMCV